MNDKPWATVLCRLFDEPNEHTFRICVPGIDDGSAVWFEAKIVRPTREEAYALLRECVKHLGNIEVEQCYECDIAPKENGGSN